MKEHITCECGLILGIAENKTHACCPGCTLLWEKVKTATISTLTGCIYEDRWFAKYAYLPRNNASYRLAASWRPSTMGISVLSNPWTKSGKWPFEL